MTSKEALRTLISNIELVMCSDEWYQCKEAIDVLEKDLEELEEAKKNKRILEVLKNFSRTYEENEDLGIMIEIWSDTKYQNEYQDIKEWVEEVHNHNKKIEEKIDEDFNRKLEKEVGVLDNGKD